MGALTELGMTYGHPGGAFYIYTNVSSTGLPSPRFCEELLRQARVMIFPGSMFGDDSDKYVRISYLQPLARIEEAVARMRGFIRASRVCEGIHEMRIYTNKAPSPEIGLWLRPQNHFVSCRLDKEIEAGCGPRS